ncbi:hypothetical protein IL306_003868 [Fusarium sp. DS 682]|nr:hypothetical protein IL306_003868 [Fusarium sp. DS 682]
MPYSFLRPELTILLSLSRLNDQPKIAPVKKIESDDWIKSIREAGADRESTDRFSGTGGYRGLSKLPFSQETFRKVAKKFLIHRSIIRVIGRADVPEFSATKLEMGELNGWAPPAYVEVEVLTRLSKATHEVCHPLVMPGIMIELERKRHMRIVEEELHEVEARARGQEEFITMLQHGTKRQVRKKMKRDEFLDVKHLCGQLSDWKDALEAMHDHADTVTSSVESSTHVDKSSQEWKRTGRKIQGRMREVMRDYNGMMRACTTASEAMNMSTQLLG